MSPRGLIGRSPSTDTPAAPVVTGQSALERRRDELAEQVAELHWDLGGLTYEMAIRDHFRLDLLLRRAAMLQERDAELAQVERMLYSQETGSAGTCATCGALRGRGAVFCWQCGTALMQQAHVPTREEGSATALTRSVAGEALETPNSQSHIDSFDRLSSPEQNTLELHGLSSPEHQDIASPSPAVKQ